MPDFLKLGKTHFVNLDQIISIRDDHDDEKGGVVIVTYLPDTEPLDSNQHHPSQIVMDRHEATKLIECAEENVEIDISLFNA
jgi:hypothetical protein